MKTIKFLMLVTFTLLIASCEKEVASPLDAVEHKFQKSLRQKPDSPQCKPIKLKFKKLTKKNRMGEFASNKMVEFNGKLWSVGGYQNGASYPNQTNAVWSSANGYNWELVTSGLFDARVGHSLTVFDGKMWLIGGVNNSSTQLSDVWFTIDGLHWKLATDTLPFWVTGHSATVFNNKLVVFTKNDIWYSTDGVNWKLMAEDIFASRSYAELIVFNDKLYLIGGETTSPDTFYNEIWQSGNGKDWSQVPTTSPIFNGISRFSTANYKHKIWVIGGHTETGFDSDEIWFSSNMIEWCKYDGPVPLTRLSSHSSLVYLDRVLVFGGFASSGMSGSIWSFEGAN